MSIPSNSEIDKAFEQALSFQSDEERIEHEAQMISFRFVSEIATLMEENNPIINKKELANKIGTSSSFITQLFQGNKLLNFPTLAKIQDIFNITFEIKIRHNNTDELDLITSHIRELYKHDYQGFWVSVRKDQSFQNDYQEEGIEIDDIDEINNPTLKIA